MCWEVPRLNTRHQVSGTEGDLLHLGEVVPRVPVESDLPHWDQRELSVRPDLGQVERVEAPGLCLLEGHDLDGHCPGGEVSLRDGIVEVPDGVVGVRLGLFVGLVPVEALDALVRLVVELAVDRLSIRVDHLEGVRAVSRLEVTITTSQVLSLSPVHESVSVRSSSVREEERHLVGRHRHQGNKVPEGVRVFEVSLGVPLLGVDETREENWIPGDVVVID